ncbi:MAG: hypothetical protein JSS66_05335 [Armatimonadetes bacterium]|nr:hypothetical protein [Armatimonadota bacterium]
MALKKKMIEGEEALHAMVDRVMSQPIPQPTQLSNPLAKKKRRMTVTDGSTAPRPDDVNDWTVRHLLDYFADKYQSGLGKKYRKAYQADQHVLHQIGSFMASNGLEKMEWSKRLVDWGFENAERVMLLQKHLSPQTFLRMVNYFIQEEVMPLVERQVLVRTEHDLSLVEEIKEAEAAGKRMEIFSRHGIPVGVTYLAQCKGLNVDAIVESFTKFLRELAKTEEGRTRIKRMVMASILGSPYPVEFDLRDWRKVFSEFCRPYYAEAWWRDVDYAGQPMAKYYPILESKE